jgi:histidinol-phosphatase (PHP family)
MVQDIVWSYHTHTDYCDGSGSVDDLVRAAIEAGVQQVGISSHAPLPFDSDWHMKRDEVARYIDDVRIAQRKYGDRIEVLLGAEIDYVPDPRVSTFQEQSLFTAGFDYFVWSVHYLADYPPIAFDGSEDEFRRILDAHYGGDIASMTGEYYRRIREMLTMPKFGMVGHLDVIKRWNQRRTYFSGDEPWYVEQVEDTLAAIARHGRAVELNTAAWRKGFDEPYPAEWILGRCRDLGIRVIVSADAHEPGDVVAGFARAGELLAELGVVPSALTLPA